MNSGELATDLGALKHIEAEYHARSTGQSTTSKHRTILDTILAQKELSSRGGIFLAYQITLSEQDYAALAAAAAKSGTDPEQFLHDMIQRLEPPSQRKHALTAHEIAEKQYHKGKISHIPTRRPLTQEERDAREQRARRFAGRKLASEMEIKDRGSY
jgi:hypothetical protein